MDPADGVTGDGAAPSEPYASLAVRRAESEPISGTDNAPPTPTAAQGTVTQFITNNNHLASLAHAQSNAHERSGEITSVPSQRPTSAANTPLVVPASAALTVPLTPLSASMSRSSSSSSSHVFSVKHTRSNGVVVDETAFGTSLPEHLIAPSRPSVTDMPVGLAATSVSAQITPQSPAAFPSNPFIASLASSPSQCVLIYHDFVCSPFAIVAQRSVCHVTSFRCLIKHQYSILLFFTSLCSMMIPPPSRKAASLTRTSVDTFSSHRSNSYVVTAKKSKARFSVELPASRCGSTSSVSTAADTSSV